MSKLAIDWLQIAKKIGNIPIRINSQRNNLKIYSGISPVRLAYTVFNPVGEANVNLAPVIFLHGITSTKEVWDTIPQIVADRSKRKAYALDARNHGDSQYTDAFSFPMNVVDLFHFLDSMKIPKAVLVGHSMGGNTAVNAALNKPERIEAIFSEDIHSEILPQSILDSCAEYAELFSEAVEEIPNSFTENEGSRFVVDYMHSKLSKDQAFFGKKEDMYNEKVALCRNSDGRYKIKFNKEVILQALKNVNTLMNEPFGRFDGPAYFLYGTISPLEIFKEEKNVRKHFPKAEFLEYENATHSIHVEFPDKFIEDLVSRLNKNKPK